MASSYNITHLTFVNDILIYYEVSKITTENIYVIMDLFSDAIQI